MKRLPVFCKSCGSRKVYWEKYFDNKGNQRFTLRDIATDTPHWENCNTKQIEGKRISIGKRI